MEFMYSDSSDETHTHTSFCQNLPSKPQDKQMFQGGSSNLPFNAKLNVQYQNDFLLFSWDLQHQQVRKGSFMRHIVLIDWQNDIQLKQSEFLIEKLYKSIKLGDFLKILITGNRNNSGWLEKTSQVCSFVVRPDGDCNNSIVQLIQKAFKKVLRCSEPVSITIFSNKANNLTSQFFRKIKKSKKYYKFHFKLSLISLSTGIGTQEKIKNSGLQIDFYNARDDAQLSRQISKCFYDLYKIRVSHARLKLICHSGDMQLQDVNNSNWQTVEGNLVKNMYALNNYTRYTEKLRLNTFTQDKICFEVQFTVKMIENQIFKMTKLFFLDVQNSSYTTDTITYIPENNSIERNMFSEIDGSALLKKINIQRIVIHKKMTLNRNFTQQVVC